MDEFIRSALFRKGHDPATEAERLRLLRALREEANQLDVWVRGALREVEAGNERMRGQAEAWASRRDSIDLQIDQVKKDLWK